MISLPSANSDITHLNRPTAQWMLFFQQVAARASAVFSVSSQPVNNGITLSDASAGVVFLDLPKPVAGSAVCVKKTDNSTNPVVLRGNGALIDGDTSFNLPTQNDAVIVVSDGTNWFVISAY